VSVRPVRDPEKNYSNFYKIIQDDEVQELIKKKKIFDNNTSLVAELNFTSLAVPTLSPSDKEELTAKILKMSDMKKEFEIDEMMKQIEKNEHNLKRVNISVSLSRENDDNVRKKANDCISKLNDLVLLASEIVYDDDSKIHLKIKKLLSDLDKINERMKRYHSLLEKQKGLMVRKIALQQNLTFFESVIHG